LKKKFNLSGAQNQKFIIVGSLEESLRVTTILRQTNSKIDSIFLVSDSDVKSVEQIGILSQLDQIVFFYNADEIIFCAKDTSAQVIMHWMSLLGSNNIDFKIAQPDSLYLIGSNSIDTAGDLYVFNINEISKQSNIRNKRTFDFVLSLCFLVSFPYFIWYFKSKSTWIKNMIQCLFGKKSLVGYYTEKQGVDQQLPTIKKGVLNPLNAMKFANNSVLSKLNLIYARDYSIWKDFEIVRKAWRKLDS
jgi:hypothetical protein